MATPRVLLIEDDVSIRRFVELALEELEIRLEEAPNLATARPALAGGGFALVIADLMLPDGSGIELLEELAARPDAPARLAFSAGIDRERRARLLELGVHEVLVKPVPVQVLLDAVTRALAAPAAAPVPHLPPAGPAPAAGGDAAVAQFFAGDRALFDAYRAQCLAQFEADIAHGELLAAEGDLPALRRLAHSLKSVLRMLGDEPAAALARTIEDAAARGDGARACADWPNLSARLQALRRA